MVASAACAFATFSTKMKFMNMKMKNNVQQTQNGKSLKKSLLSRSFFSCWIQFSLALFCSAASREERNETRDSNLVLLAWFALIFLPPA